MLSETLKQLAATFADNVVEIVEAEMRAKMTSALSTLGVDGDSEVATPRRKGKTPKPASKSKSSKTSSTRLARRSPEEIAAVVATVAKLVSKHKDGLRSEEIRKTLDLDVREVPRVLREGIASGALKSTGQKRATVYFVGKGGKAKASKPVKAKASSKKTVKKAKKAKASGKKAPKAKKSASKKSTSKKAKASKSTANGAAGHATAAAEATA